MHRICVTTQSPRYITVSSQGSRVWGEFCYLRSMGESHEVQLTAYNNEVVESEFESEPGYLTLHLLCLSSREADPPGQEQKY